MSELVARRDLNGVGLELINIKAHLEMREIAGFDPVKTERHILKHVENALSMYYDIFNTKTQKQIIITSLIEQLVAQV
jgi:hypothetical protein